MPTKKTSGTTAKRKSTRPVPKKKTMPRKSSAKAAPPEPAAPAGDRLHEVARSIGSTVGDIVKKTKRVLYREPYSE